MGTGGVMHGIIPKLNTCYLYIKVSGMCDKKVSDVCDKESCHAVCGKKKAEGYSVLS